MSDINVLALVGSLRAASVNRQIAEVASENGPDGISVAVYDGLGDVPLLCARELGIEHVELDGPFADGTWFTMKPPGQDA